MSALNPLSRAWRWLALVLPRSDVLFLIVFFLAVFEGLYLWVLSINAGPELQTFRNVRDALLRSVVGVYGIYRASVFSPVFHTSYRKWLELTPWRFGQRLPMGPVLLVIQDFVVLALYQAVAFDATLTSRALIVSSFLYPWSAATAWGAYEAGERWCGYLVGLLLGAAIVAYQFGPWVQLGAMVVATAAAHWALIRSLRRFPWESISTELERTLAALNVKRQPAGYTPNPISNFGLPAGHGWPIDHLGFALVERLPVIERLVRCCLIGWWAFGAALFIPPEHTQVGAAALAYLGVGMAIRRLVKYLSDHQGPLSIWARVITLRWIMPRYDLVFLAPLLMLLGGFAGLVIYKFWLTESGSWIIASFQSMIVLILLLLDQFFPPSFERWHLLAPVRLTPRMYRSLSHEFVEV